MSPMWAHLTAAADRLRRAGAVAAAMLTLALAVFASSPVLHHWLHGAGGDQTQDGCAVVLFATGVTAACADIAVAALPQTARAPRAIFRESVALANPRYRLQPERGPPAA